MADTPSVQDQLAASIAGAGTADYKPVEIELKQDATPAPAEGNPDPEAKADDSVPTDGQPAKAVQEPAKAETKKADEPPPPDDPNKVDPDKVDNLKPKDGEKAPEQPEKQPDEETLLREALGLPKTEADTVETLKTRYEASSKEAHRLVEEDKAKAQALAEAGVEVVRTKEGKFALKASQKYLDSLKDEDLPDVYSKLTGEDKELVTEEVARKIVKTALAEVLPKRPIAKVTSEDAVLPDHEVDKCFSGLAAEKLSNGQPRFADLNDDSVVRLMRELYDRPDREGLKTWMNQSTDNFKQGLSMIHAEVFRVRAPLLAAKRDAEAARKAEQEKLKKKPATVTTGAGVTPDAMRSRGTPSGGQDAAAIALKIASAQAT